MVVLVSSVPDRLSSSCTGGKTFEEIGDEVGRSAATCCRYVRRTLEQGGIHFMPRNHGGMRHESFGVRGRYLLCALVGSRRSPSSDMLGG